MPTIKKHNNWRAVRQRTAEGSNHWVNGKDRNAPIRAVEKTTNHIRASCFIISRMTSRPHRLKKTTSRQSKRRDLIQAWLHHETNGKLSFYCYSPRWITTTFSTKIYACYGKTSGQEDRTIFPAVTLKLYWTWTSRLVQIAWCDDRQSAYLWPRENRCIVENKTLPLDQRKLSYNATVKQTMLYASTVWASCSVENIRKVFRLQKCAARVILGADRKANNVQVFKQLGLVPFMMKRKQISTFLYINSFLAMAHPLWLRC